MRRIYCTTFTSPNPPEDPDDQQGYWSKDGMTLCICGHNARAHNLAGRQCETCNKELNATGKIWRCHRCGAGGPGDFDGPAHVDLHAPDCTQKGVI